MDGAAAEDRVPCEDFATCGVAQYQNRQYSKNVKQQDSYFVVEDVAATFGVLLGHSQNISLFGVCDGHGEFGEMSANFVRRNMPPQMVQSPHYAAGRLNDALMEAFATTEFLQQSAGLPLYASGTCVTCAAVSPTTIVVANCGDCRAVLAVGGVAKDLSNDFNVEGATPEEINRILTAGGTIGPDKRVTVAGAPGRLATTRSLGDYWAKPQGPQKGHIVCGLPELRSIARQPGQQYLILASDGIFGFMSSQDVVTLCINSSSQVAHSTPLSRLAHTTVCTAVNARRSDDNCTCLVVDLTRIEGPVPRSVPRGPDVRHGHHYGGEQSLVLPPQTPPAALRNGCGDDAIEKSPGKDSSDVSLSSLVAPDEVCWCAWCWRQNRDGQPENVVLGSFERWRLHMHEQHFDKLGGAYGPDEVVPCYWCCRPCVTKKGQSRNTNRLPFWGSHERVCRENPNRPSLPSQTGSTGSSSISAGSNNRPHAYRLGDEGRLAERSSFERGTEHRWPDGSSSSYRQPSPLQQPAHYQHRGKEFRRGPGHGHGVGHAGGYSAAGGSSGGRHRRHGDEMPQAPLSPLTPLVLEARPNGRRAL